MTYFSPPCGGRVGVGVVRVAPTVHLARPPPLTPPHKGTRGREQIRARGLISVPLLSAHGGESVMQRFAANFRIFLSLFLPYFRGEDRWAGRALLTGVIVLEFLLVYVAVLVNQWNGRFFNALEARDFAAIQVELVFFGVIVLAAIATGGAQYWLGQHLLIRWRRWMTERFVGLWMADARHYRIRFVDQSVDNIHLRIGNDVYVFISKTYELGSGLIGHVIATTSFAVILWGISASTPLPLFGVDLAFPGYLIVVAFLYAMFGTLIAHLIGRPLIPLNFQQNRYEADFRFA